MLSSETECELWHSARNHGRFEPPRRLRSSNGQALLLRVLSARQRPAEPSLVSIRTWYALPVRAGPMRLRWLSVHCNDEPNGGRFGGAARLGPQLARLDSPFVWTHFSRLSGATLLPALLVLSMGVHV
jgi:hypothetical protein